MWRDSGDGVYYSLYDSDLVLATSFFDTDVKKGQSYKYKYRARNINGYGELSEESYMTAATIPSQPPAPALISVDSTEIVLKFSAPSDSGGLEVSSYTLQIDDGDLNTAFADEGTYDGSSLTHTVDMVALTNTLGKIYTFRFKATNSIGDSEYSDFLRVGYGDTVAKPTGLSADLSLTGPTYISLFWNQVPDDDLPTLGYVL